MPCEEIRYLVNLDIIPLYIDSAKTFMTLSTGALGLTIAFREKIVGAQPGTRVGILMLLSWLFFLFTAMGLSISNMLT